MLRTDEDLVIIMLSKIKKWRFWLQPLLLKSGDRQGEFLLHVEEKLSLSVPVEMELELEMELGHSSRHRS